MKLIYKLTIIINDELQWDYIFDNYAVIEPFLQKYKSEFDSINDAANSLHILACNISNCLKGRQKSTPRGLYTWKYKF